VTANVDAIRKLVDEVELVSEDDMLKAIGQLLITSMSLRSQREQLQPRHF